MSSAPKDTGWAAVGQPSLTRPGSPGRSGLVDWDHLSVAQAVGDERGEERVVVFRIEASPLVSGTWPEAIRLNGISLSERTSARPDQVPDPLSGS
jgi:hypothetical protein